ncbi:DUF6385 domain-containing protein [Paenibacillus sp. B-A-8]|uniref:DUF6385 domain-containing protein n=1 Tax=Paenibacillus sp. B-A-8 TaxID=3400419 RepID=UPI003B01A2D3
MQQNKIEKDGTKTMISYAVKNQGDHPASVGLKNRPNRFDCFIDLAETAASKKMRVLVLNRF